jgi:hypothetical protein
MLSNKIVFFFYIQITSILSENVFVEKTLYDSINNLITIDPPSS